MTLLNRPENELKIFLRVSKIFSKGGTLINFENGGRGGGHPYQFQNGRIGRKTLIVQRVFDNLNFSFNYFIMGRRPISAMMKNILCLVEGLLCLSKVLSFS